MKKITKLLALLIFVPALSHAEGVAMMPNKAGGKIVLTDDVCRRDGKTFSPLMRAYFYTQDGYTQDGCWYAEDETVLISWPSKDGKTFDQHRYLIKDFTVTKKTNDTGVIKL